MSDRVHVIEIDRIVLSGVDQRNPSRMSALIEAEVQRALSGSDLGSATGLANNEARVAGAVTRAVVRSIQGGSDYV